MIGSSIDWTQAIGLIVILAISIDFHEFAHAIVAYRLGDDTPARNGQLSLNPLVHMDQVGVLLLVITSIVGYPFTYGRTLIQPNNLKFGPQRGGAIVAAAGPLTNLLLALVAGLALHFVSPHGPLSSGTCIIQSQYVYYLAMALYVNCALFVFNLLPIPPLDGFNILSGFLTTRQLYSLAPFIQYAPFLILLIFLFPSLSSHIFTTVNHLGSFIYPFMDDWYFLPTNVLSQVGGC